MSTIQFANNASSTLAGAISNTAVTCALAPGGGALFPNPGAGQYFVMTFTDQATGLLNEIVWVTGRSGDTLIIERGQEGTTPLSWLAGDFARNLWTAGQAGALFQTSAFQGQQTTAYLEYVNPSQIALLPHGGNVIVINGSIYQIPAGGIVSGLTSVYVSGVASQNLIANQLYDVFMFNNAGSPAFDFWPTTGNSHITDTTTGNVGIEVRNNSGSPDSTRSYIGKVLMNATPAFQLQGVGVISWFNRKNIQLPSISSVSTFTTSSTAFVEISTTLRLPFLCFDNDAVILTSGGLMNSNTSAATVAFGIGKNGAVQFGNAFFSYAEGTSQNVGSPVPAVAFFPEGSNFATPVGSISSGAATASFADVASYGVVRG